MTARAWIMNLPNILLTRTITVHRAGSQLKSLCMHAGVMQDYNVLKFDDSYSLENRQQPALPNFGEKCTALDEHRQIAVGFDLVCVDHIWVPGTPAAKCLMMKFYDMTMCSNWIAYCNQTITRDWMEKYCFFECLCINYPHHTCCPKTK